MLVILALPQRVRSPPSASWSSGPADPRGLLFDASDRNILCMSLRANFCIVGSADHGLKNLILQQASYPRALFKQCGTEWVTCVEYLQMVGSSGGMDSKLCLWQGRRCIDLTGHSASVSTVSASANGKCCISTGYDKTVRIGCYCSCFDIEGPFGPYSQLGMGIF